MSNDTLTNFIKATKDVMDDIKTKLETSSEWTEVRVKAGVDYENIWKTLADIAEPPVCIVVYDDSEYGFRPRRTLRFSVVVVSRQMANDATAEEEAMDLLDEVMSLLDHEVYSSQVIYKVVGDSWLEYNNAMLDARRIQFIGEDY